MSDDVLDDPRVRQLIAAGERVKRYLEDRIEGRRPASDHEDILAGRQLAEALLALKVSAEYAAASSDPRRS